MKNTALRVQLIAQGVGSMDYMLGPGEITEIN